MTIKHILIIIRIIDQNTTQSQQKLIIKLKNFFDKFITTNTKIKNNKGISNIILHSILKFDISKRDLIAVLTGTLPKSHSS